MKRLRFKPWILALRSLTALFVVAVVSLFMLSMKVNEVTDDVWKQLGITQKDANINIMVSFREGHLQYAGAKLAKNIAESNRVAVVNELGAYAKKYAASEEFKREYAANRERRKPPPVMLMPVESVADIKAQEKERIEKAIKDTEANANHPNPKVKNAVPFRLDALKKELAALDDPNNATIKRKLDNTTRMNEQIQKQYDQKVQKWETDYPENPQLLIKKRLQQILDITADVDYGAELKDSYDKKLKIFVNPVYEKKPAEWKMAYRAGKQTTDAVRAFAQKWLSEIK